MTRPSPALAVLLALALSPPVWAQETIVFSWNGYEAEIPADPQRVFVMDSRTGLEFALLADYPIVATDWDESSHFRLDPSTEKLSFRGEPNAELALSYEPDLLVVGRGWWEHWQNNNAFNGEGLTVLVVEDANGDNWKELMLGQMKAIGKLDAAEAALATYEAEAAAARQVIAERLDGAPVALADIWNPESFALHVDTFDAAVARDIGLDLVRSDAEVSNGYQVHSPENLSAFADAALIVANVFNPAAVDNPMWRRLPAVVDGNVYDLHLANSWGFALTATDLVQDLVSYVRAARMQD